MLSGPKDRNRVLMLWLRAQLLSSKTTLVLSNTRELDRVPSTK